MKYLPYFLIMLINIPLYAGNIEILDINLFSISSIGYDDDDDDDDDCLTCTDNDDDNYYGGSGNDNDDDNYYGGSGNDNDDDNYYGGSGSSNDDDCLTCTDNDDDNYYGGSGSSNDDDDCNFGPSDSFNEEDDDCGSNYGGGYLSGRGIGDPEVFVPSNSLSNYNSGSISFPANSSSLSSVSNIDSVSQPKIISEANQSQFIGFGGRVTKSMPASTNSQKQDIETKDDLVCQMTANLSVMTMLFKMGLINNIQQCDPHN